MRSVGGWLATCYQGRVSGSNKMIRLSHFLVLLAIGCTRGRAAPSPSGGASSAGAQSGEAEVASAEPVPHLVQDVRQRWVISVLSKERPRRDEQPGYVDITVSLGSVSSSHCFVYERPLEPGQAVQRLLRAVASGLTFERVQLQSIELVNEYPLLLFRAPYHTTLQQSPRAGVLQVGLAARSDFPIVCLHDAVEFEAAFARWVRHAVSGFVPSHPQPDPPFMREVWLLEDGARPFGVATYRVWKEGGGHRTLLISSRFESVGATMRTQDHAELDLLDENGVFRKELIELSDTERRLQVSLRRTSPPLDAAATPHPRQEESVVAPYGPAATPDSVQAPAFRFVFEGHLRMEKLGGEFTLDEPLAAGITFYEFLGGQTQLANIWEYRPAERVNGPVSRQLRRVSDQSAESRGPGSVTLITLDSAGLPRKSQVVGPSGDPTWTLLGRWGGSPF